MVLTPFPSAGKQLEKVLNLYHARSYENPSIFDFKQSDGKLYQNRKQGEYGGVFYFKLCLLEYKKKSSRIKYGYYHVMDLKSKCKLYGAKLLIAVL